MEMVSGVLRVLLASNLWLFLLPACQPKADRQEGPFILYTDKGLYRRPGILYYQDKAFSGTIVELYPNGDTSATTEYMNGHEHGYVKTWYPNRQLREERHYQNGRKHGIHKGWWENGQAKFYYELRNDLLQGNVKEWTENGQLYRDFNYVNGQESGRQRLWFDDGKLRANYEVREGRRYGLMDTKNCESTDAIILQ